MKKIILFIFLLVSISPITILAQNSGVITYDMTLNLHAALPADKKAFKMMIPKEKKNKVTVTFNENYAKIETTDVKDESSKGVTMIVGSGNDYPIYIDLKNKERIDILELDGKYFGTRTPLAEADSIPIIDANKQILDYNCTVFEKTQEMELMISESKDNESRKKEDNEESLKATVLIAEDLPKGITPMAEVFWQGTLLAFDSGIIQYEATNILLETIDDNDVMPDQEFIEVSEEQMKDLQEEKQEVMLKEFKF